MTQVVWGAPLIVSVLPSSIKIHNIPPCHIVSGIQRGLLPRLINAEMHKIQIGLKMDSRFFTTWPFGVSIRI